MKPLLLIYKLDLLPYSETFILEQARSFSAFRVVFICERGVEGLDLGDFEVLVLERKWTKLFLKDEAQVQVFREAKVCLCHFLTSAVFIYDLCRMNHVRLFIMCHGFDVSLNRLKLSNGFFKSLMKR